MLITMSSSKDYHVILYYNEDNDRYAGDKVGSPYMNID